MMRKTMTFFIIKLIAVLVALLYVNFQVAPQLERRMPSRAARLRGGMMGMLCTGVLGAASFVVFSNPFLLYFAALWFGGGFLVSSVVCYRVLAGSDLPNRI